jgi:hypothetical protein
MVSVRHLFPGNKEKKGDERKRVKKREKERRKGEKSRTKEQKQTRERKCLRLCELWSEGADKDQWIDDKPLTRRRRLSHSVAFPFRLVLDLCTSCI